MLKRGLFIGRFQPFHLGHLEVIKKILTEVKEVVIVIGSSQYSHLVDNPFTAGERIFMVRSALEESEILCNFFWIVPVPDVHLHMMWVSALKGYTPQFQIVYSNEPLTQRLFKEAGYQVEPIRFYKRKLYSSTEIRRRIIEGERWEELVPFSVAEYLKKIDGINRLKDLVKSDKS
jgi:nicotinamide-nucleotide adenylyltransferase